MPNASTPPAITTRVFAPVVLLPLLSLGLGGCGQDPTDHYRPVIRSLTASRSDLYGPVDSMTITCIATDRDGDRLVYDWETDARLRIQGNRPNEYSLYNTHENSHVFYVGPAGLHPDLDTAWVWVGARDGRGMSSSRLITVRIHH